ncbi:Gfo/Idh/MocA family protein [Streptomyces sp. NPDC059994]|uniref:Gfo/Idh/MocA family protein n=1 Tax=Streptomyces sp. NPDC059994 TaxID=3347029 RepID=UPI0036A490C0
MKNFLVIGVGPHARRSHLPALAAGQSRGLVGTVYGVDILGAMDVMLTFDADDGPRTLPVTLIEPFDAAPQSLPDRVRATLDALVVRHRIDAVVVSTEPAYHLVYTRWALERGLSVLLDKPLSVHTGASTNPPSAAAILADFDSLLDCYELARRRHPGLIVSVQCQRRYHPAFWKMRQLIAEITEETGCPVTSIQSSHSDGQWRLPDELVDLSYHGFDQGYGKAAHSGYHFFDIVPWLLAAGEREGKELDAVTVHAQVTRPGDFLAQLTVHDHERLFPAFAARNRYTDTQLRAATHAFGEVDAFISLAFHSGGRTMTLGSLNLIHNGFSERGNMTPAASLYKGNGRVRQESHIVHQGPFQALHFLSLQTLGDPSTSAAPYAIGHESHIEVHVFRNNRFSPGWTRHQRLGYHALTTLWEADVAVPTQQSSRRRATHEFLEYLDGRRTREQVRSDLTSHRPAATLMSGAYLSMANQFSGSAAPQITLGLRHGSRTESMGQPEAAL